MTMPPDTQRQALSRFAVAIAGGLVVLVLGATVWAQADAGGAGAAPASHWLADVVERNGIWLGLLAVLLGGLALNLTPCVYPMIPVTLAFFSGQAAGGTLRTLRLALLYVCGISLSYAVLGLFAAKTGALLGSWLQQPAVVLTVSAVICALALSMFGFYELRPPAAVARLLGQAPAGLLGAFVMGLVVGLVAAPCVGPFILGLLLVIGKLGSAWLGFALLFTLGVGMGLPYLFLALAADRVGHLPRSGAWLVWIKQALGFVLLGLALYFVRSLLSPWLLTGASVALLLAAAVYLGWLARPAPASRPFRLFRWGAALVLLAAAVGTAWPRPAPVASNWTPYTEAAFERARAERRPVIIDIYADWCIPCVELDHATFRHPDVVRALEHAATFRVDATREVSPDAERLLERYDVIGVPTVLLIGPDGEERAELRLMGFEPPQAFLERLKRIL
ncbi:MAG TPA: cytochrome c biogenesis protein CcdA [bacterium]